MRDSAIRVSLRVVPPAAFADLLSARVSQRESQIVLGLDPDPLALWPASGDAAAGTPAERAGAAVAAHCRAVIEAVGPACVGVKFQLACFERIGSAGWAALSAAVVTAKDAGLVVIADAKRGDFPPTARAYGQALAGTVESPFGLLPGLGADAFTANPFLGIDSLEPLIATGAGVFVLVRTSNPGAADFQDLELATGGTLWERVARTVAALGSPRACGLTDVGAVVGATAPGHLERARELMPQTIFLLPGVGAQGGRVEDLAAAFLPGRAGGLVSSSRGIVDAHREHGTDPATAARTEAERLRRLAWSLT
jgi:orotidine-5'-phosphate decarboxylase